MPLLIGRRNVKRHLIEATTPILSFPILGKPFIIDTEVRGVNLGVVLSQEQDGVEHVIAYYSRWLTKAESRYCVTRQEFLALVEAIKHSHHFVYGVPTLVWTDYGALTWLLSFKIPEGRMARWLEVIGEYNLTIRHSAGQLHGYADALSRRPCNNCKHCESKEVNEVVRIRIIANQEGDQINDLAGWAES